jgi:CHAD domain-containing protein
MTSQVQALRAADGATLDLASVAATLADQFTVVTRPSQLIRRVRLDTFDRRLHAAELTLEHQVAGSQERLVLDGPACSSTVTVPATEPRWPVLAAGLPDGPIRTALAPVIGIRALLVVSDEKRRVRRLELHNEDDKTVARVQLDEPATATAAPPQLTVLALRGYEDLAGRALRLLTRAGLRQVDHREAHAADVQPTAGIVATSPAIALLAAQLGEFLAAMRDNLPGLLDDVDTEFLHDFRVAVRRTRSTLKLGRLALPEVMHRRWEPAFKWLGDLTTPVRDLDIYELDLPVMTTWLVAAEATDLDELAQHLRRRRSSARRAMVQGLRSARFRRLMAGWHDTLTRLAEGSQDLTGEQLSAGVLAQRSIRRAYRRVARDGAAISPESPAEHLHELRKRCKELRYALEVFAPVIENGPRKRAVADLKSLQDVLGRFQDCEVQRLALRDFAEEMMADGTPASAVLAMGELIGHLDVEQDRARERFDGAFASFTRPSGRQRMQRLGGGR